MKINEITMTTPSRVTSVRPGQSAEIDHGDGTKTVVDLKANPNALLRDPATGKLRLSPGNKDNKSADTPKVGDNVEIDQDS
jgi:hypothetical protein